MLKNTVDQTAYDGLADNLKSEYVKTGDKFTLQHDEPAGELKRGKDRIAGELTEAKATITTLETKLSAVPSIDVVKAAAKAELTAEFEPIKATLATRESQISTLLVEGTAKQLALSIGGTKNADALLPHVTSRLSAKLDGDTPAVVVMKDGKPSELKVSDLETELRADARLSSLVIASQASGGAGRPITKSNTPAGGAGNVANLATMKPADLVASLSVGK